MHFSYLSFAILLGNPKILTLVPVYNGLSLFLKSNFFLAEPAPIEPQCLPEDH